MKKTPTDILIESLEHASSMNHVLVISAGPMPTETEGAIGRQIYVSTSGDPEDLGDAAKALALVEHAAEVMRRHLIVAAFDSSEEMPAPPEKPTEESNGQVS